MSNIFRSVTPEFTKQSMSEFFVDPMFMGQDVRGAITVRTDIKGTETLNRIARPSMITKAKNSPGFTPNGDFILTAQNITVKPMAIEFEQNAKEFWGSVIEQLLASGYKEDDIENMKSPDIWNKIILPIIAQSGQQDLIRQMWFNNTTTLSGDDNYNAYYGFFELINNAFQTTYVSYFKQKINAGTDGVRFKAIIGIPAGFTTDDYIHFKISNHNFSIPYNADMSLSFGDFVTENAADILADSNIILTQQGATSITLESQDYKDPIFTIDIIKDDTSVVDPAVTLTEADPPHYEDDEVDDVMDQMLGVAPSEMLELKPVFQMSRAAYRNLFRTWKNLGSETANMIQFNGLSTPSYEGIPIIVHPEWDMWDKALDNLTPGRILLTPPKNLIFATDGAEDSEMIETWYNKEEQMRRYRVQYKAQTAILHNSLLVVAGMV